MYSGVINDDNEWTGNGSNDTNPKYRPVKSVCSLQLGRAVGDDSPMSRRRNGADDVNFVADVRYRVRRYLRDGRRGDVENCISTRHSTRRRDARRSR